MTKNRADTSGCNDELATYRVLVKQPLSMELDTGEVLDLSIQEMACRLSIRPEHGDPATQREIGGAILAIELQTNADLDLITVARGGFQLIEDFLSALSVASGMTFEKSTLVQVARLTKDETLNCEFVQFNPLYLRHWHNPVSAAMIKSASKLLAHWDGLEIGNRLRRAASRYRAALGTSDDVSAFQEAYIGLESLEKPLAIAAGLTPGSEEVSGKCDACGHVYVRKRTALVGVRTFVHASKDIKAADPQRRSEWKLMNELRNDLMHGLEDLNELGDRPHTALLASMHYLHDAICHLCHVSDLVADTYRMARGGSTFVTCGRYSASSWPSLEEWGELLGPSSLTWVKHPIHGLVPEINVKNSDMTDLELIFGGTRKPFAVASFEDIDPVNVEFGHSEAEHL